MAKRKKKRHPSKRLAVADIVEIVEIVGDAAIAGPVAEGVNIPLVILDTRSRVDLSELIRVQQHVPSGDVRFEWGGTEDRETVLLELEFDRPAELRAVIPFDIERQGILVEAALTARALYLQGGVPGDRVKHDISRPKMIVELPETGFRPIWDKLFVERMAAVISRDQGISQRSAVAHARALIKELRVVTDFRMPRQ